MDAIILQNISKKYTLVQDRPILLKNLFLPQKKEEVWALKNVSLTIKKGETIGIIGENGSGKSTLLKIIAGITTPTSGTVAINGKVASLIELGAGFHQDLTGRENIYLNGSLLGLTRKEIDKKYKEIVGFADIGKFIDQPIRTYSSGMTVRLGFSVAVHLDPDILLIDEVLAVGDEEFQGKCIEKIQQFKKNNITIILVSHNLHLIKNICQKVMWISFGIAQYFSKSQNGIKKYLDYLNKLEEIERQKQSSKENKRTSKSKRSISIRKVEFLDKDRKCKHVFFPGDRVMVKIFFRFQKPVNPLVFGILVRNELSEIIFGTNTELDDFVISKLPSDGHIDYLIPFLPLKHGIYNFDITARGKYESDIYDKKEGMFTIEVKRKQRLGLGDIDFKGEWNV